MNRSVKRLDAIMTTAQKKKWKANRGDAYTADERSEEGRIGRTIISGFSFGAVESPTQPRGIVGRSIVDAKKLTD